VKLKREYYIEVVMWTGDEPYGGGSTFSTGAASITRAIEILKESQEFYDSWTLTYHPSDRDGYKIPRLTPEQKKQLSKMKKEYQDGKD
jgi:hypothetical protein